MASLATLPLDVLHDVVLPCLAVGDLARLARTSHDFHHLVISGPDAEGLWRRKIAQDFSFPIANTGRRSGWLLLYRQLLRQSLFVWGQHGNGRLGIPHRRARALSKLLEGGMTLPTQLSVPASIVGLEAGGWSFHALTSTGGILVWGTMNGETWVGRGAALSNPGLAIEEPRELAATASGATGEVVQLEVGRSHAVVRNAEGQVWEYRSFGRAYQVVDSNGAWGTGLGGARAVVAVDAGWSHSAVLTGGGDVYIWWEFSRDRIARLAREAGEDKLEDSSKEGVTFVVETESAVHLPDLPRIRRGDSSLDDDKIVSIASGDQFILALTRDSLVYRLDISPIPTNRNVTVATDPEDSPVMSRDSRARMETAFQAGGRSWECLRRFCDMEVVCKLPIFSGLGDGQLEHPPASTRITHISAHFHSFAVYSVPSSSAADQSTSSIVLLGTDETGVDSAPQVLRELQGKSIIKIAFGDYHTLALTSSGQIYSWGAFSAGALGLGHPSLPNTPLSAVPQVTAVRGFNARQLPPSVARPTLIHFPGDDNVDPVESQLRTQGKFVFHVTASGWSSGALAVELSDEGFEADEEARRETAAREVEEEDANRIAEAEAEEEMRRLNTPGAFPGSLPRVGGVQDPEAVPDIGVFPGGRTFRIGYPGRGMFRGGRGRGDGGQ